MTKYNVTMTDSLERELLNQEIGSYYNDVPLNSVFGWVGAGLKNLQRKLVSFVAATSRDMDTARAEGHKVTAA